MENVNSEIFFGIVTLFLLAQILLVVLKNHIAREEYERGLRIGYRQGYRQCQILGRNSVMPGGLVIRNKQQHKTYRMWLQRKWYEDKMRHGTCAPARVQTPPVPIQNMPPIELPRCLRQ